MIARELTFGLPHPWPPGNSFTMKRHGSVNFLVGPNGTGKSQFARILKQALSNTFYLETDRLAFADQSTVDFHGDRFALGHAKSSFGHMTKASHNAGSGIGTFVILEERPDIKIKVEVALSNLFRREIHLEWDSGNLKPMAAIEGSINKYRLDREECHGIRELLVILTHLYNDQFQYLIIDEPEQNLHPQLQAFLIQEIRRVAGVPHSGTTQKTVFLITHSPFMVDVRSFDDLASVIAFSSNLSPPVMLNDTSEDDNVKLAPMLGRLNANHKQLFFSDNPVFVEGITDAQVFEAIQSKLGHSIHAAGSCFIETGGNAELLKYLSLCKQFRKSAYFVFDLDSLFIGKLSSTLGKEERNSEFLAQLGVCPDVSSYIGELHKILGASITQIEGDISPELAELREYLGQLKALAKFDIARARYAVMLEVGRNSSVLEAILGKACVLNIASRLNNICEMLEAQNIILLRDGALENYLPSYSGCRYRIDESSKAQASSEELEFLYGQTTEAELKSRYGRLIDHISKLPFEKQIDIIPYVKKYAARYVYELQQKLVSSSTWNSTDINEHFARHPEKLGKLFNLKSFTRQNDGSFNAEIAVLCGNPATISINNTTNAGMGGFEIIEN
jgi:AAA ATPase domain